jgi:hydrogenase maturation protease
MNLPSNVEAADGGTFGLDLLDLIANREKLIVIDAADIDGPPGFFIKLSHDDLAGQVSSLSLHDVGLVELLAVAKKLKLMPSRIVIFAVKPASIEPGLDLSPSVSAALPLLIRAILDELNSRELP